MGRHPEGLKVVWRDGYGIARFTWQGKREFLSTGETDPARAQVKAEELYAAVISGKRRKVKGARRVVLQPLDVLFSEWLATLEGVLDPETVQTYRRTYVPTHFLPHFRTFERVEDESVIDAYARARLRKVLRKTLHKELGALRQFLKWCKMETLIDAVPPFPEYPSTARGKRSGKQRAKANELTEDQVRAAIAALPVMSARISRRDRKLFVVRPRFVVAYETGLRPETLNLISIPEHWAPGRKTLRVTEDIDKVRYERELTLTPAALEALEETVRLLGLTKGPIFGAHDYRAHLRKTGLDDELRTQLAPYDFRHARGTHLTDRGATQTGIAYQLGHTQVTTTSKYVHPSRRAGDKALSAGGALDDKMDSGAIPDREKK